MRTWKVVMMAVLTAGAGTGLSWATPEKAVETKTPCAGCHVNPAGGAEFNEAGKAFQAAGKFEKAPVVDKASTAVYIGTKKCKMCHKPQFESWGTTEHAKAFKSLEEAKPEEIQKAAERLGVKLEGKASEAPACLSCHVTGYGLEGGYTKEKGKDDMLDAMSCEGCHGPGSLHMKAKKDDKAKTISGHPGEALCVSCHTKAMSPEFKYDEYVKKGVHKSFKK